MAGFFMAGRKRPLACRAAIANVLAHAAGRSQQQLPNGLKIGLTAEHGRDRMAARYAETPAQCRVVQHAADCGDRKSTRLNSSHGYISYAVFCLKTKNNALH